MARVAVTKENHNQAVDSLLFGPDSDSDEDGLRNSLTNSPRLELLTGVSPTHSP